MEIPYGDRWQGGDCWQVFQFVYRYACGRSAHFGRVGCRDWQAWPWLRFRRRGGYIHDELGIEGHADPFQQRDGGHDAACF